LNLRTYKARLSYLPPKNDAKDEVQSLPALNDPLPPEWITIEDDFILFWSSQVTHASYNVIQSPSSKMQDGLFRLFLVRKPCSRITLARILLGMETGSHTSINKAEFIDCIAYRLEPLESGSFNDLDGEVIESGPIQGFVNPSAISFFRNS
jgi:sphingosine kinase